MGSKIFNVAHLVYVLQICYHCFNINKALALFLKMSCWNFECLYPNVLLCIYLFRHLWDPSFLKSKIIAHLSNNTEVFQYMCSQLPPHPHCDFCVLRQVPFVYVLYMFKNAGKRISNPQSLYLYITKRVIFFQCKDIFLDFLI